MFLALVDPDSINIGSACLIALVCMLIVFSMLALLWGIVSLFKFIPSKKEKKEEQEAKPSLKLEDIKDDDMMVAALVATIDYHEETKKDVKVVSIKEI